MKKKKKNAHRKEQSPVLPPQTKGQYQPPHRHQHNNQVYSDPDTEIKLSSMIHKKTRQLTCWHINQVIFGNPDKTYPKSTTQTKNQVDWSIP